MEENKQPQISEQEVFDVLKFANYLNSNPSAWQGGVYTPDILHSVLQQVNSNPLIPTPSNIDSSLSNPNNNEGQLVGYSEYFNNTTMLYKRVGNYLTNMLSFDLRISCINASGADYKSREYKDDLKRVYKWLDKMNIKREFPKILQNMFRQGQVFTVLRVDSEEGYAIQQLPSAYCKTTGHINITDLFDFNMNFFMKPSTSLKNYPPSMTEYYNDVFLNKGEDKYYPSNKLGSRDGSFSLWHQTDPELGYFVFSIDPSVFTNIPYLAPMMNDAYNVGLLRKLQTQKDIAGASALLLGEIGFLKEGTGGIKADALNISPAVLATFLQLVKSGLNEVWNIGGVPLQEMEQYQYEDKNTTMYSEQLKNVAGQAVSLSRVIYCSDKMSQIEAELALETDGNMVQRLYRQFEDYLNFYVNMKTRNYKFQFYFEGLNYSINRENRFDLAMQSASVGIVLPSLFQASLGLSPQEFDREMERARETGFSDQLTQLLSIHTATGEEKGRPRKKRTVKGRGDYDE